jgi:hypothetical protein
MSLFESGCMHAAMSCKPGERTLLSRCGSAEFPSRTATCLKLKVLFRTACWRSGLLLQMHGSISLLGWCQWPAPTCTAHAVVVLRL